MGLYRCAACGSPNVVTDTQTGGIKYDFVKGAIGTIALGAGGAAAGIKNQQQRVFKCPDCGVTLTYPMPEEIKKAIDLGVMSPAARKQTFVGNSLFTWEYLTQTYKNIESGFDNRQAEQETRLIKAYQEEMRTVIELGEIEYPKYEHFLSTTCNSRFRYSRFASVQQDVARYLVYHFAELGSACKESFKENTYFLKRAVPELPESDINFIFKYLFGKGVLNSSNKYNYQFIVDDTLFWIDDDWYEGIPNRAKRGLAEGDLQKVVSDVDTSTKKKKSGQIGDRPYARGRSFDPSHYGE